MLQALARQALAPQAGWKTNVLSSMLSRSGASAGAVGSVKALWGAKRARPSVRELKHFSSKASSGVIAER